MGIKYVTHQDLSKSKFRHGMRDCRCRRFCDLEGKETRDFLNVVRLGPNKFKDSVLAYNIKKASESSK